MSRGEVGWVLDFWVFGVSFTATSCKNLLNLPLLRFRLANIKFTADKSRSLRKMRVLTKKHGHTLTRTWTLAHTRTPRGYVLFALQFLRSLRFSRANFTRFARESRSLQLDGLSAGHRGQVHLLLENAQHQRLVQL